MSRPAVPHSGALLLALAVLTACDGSTDTADPLGPDSNENSDSITGIEVRPNTVQLPALGRSSQLRASLQPAGTPLDPALVIWTSSDTTVTVVDESGLVTAQENGVTSITGTYRHVTGASARNFSAVSNVTVDQLPDSIALSREHITLAGVGDTATLHGEIFDAEGYRVAGDTLDWSTSDSTVVVIDGHGVAKAMGLGTATGTARTGGIQDSVSLEVIAQPARIELDADTVIMTAIGDTLRLSAVIYDHSGNVIGGVAPVWSTGAEEVATVNASGVLFSVGVGTTDVVATLGALSAAARVHVSQAPATLSVTPKEGLLTSLGASLSLAATVLDRNAHPIPDQRVTWTSGATRTVEVDSRGRVTSRARGSAWITARAGSIADSARITVVQRPSTVIFRGDDLDRIPVGGHRVLSALLYDSLGTFARVAESSEWASRDSTIAVPGVDGISLGSTWLVVSAGAARDSVRVTIVPDQERSIVYVVDSDLYRVSPIGGPPLRLTSTGELELNPLWSPDRSRVSYTTRDHQVGVIGANGGGAIRVTDGVHQHRHPQWSPDGTRIVSQMRDGGIDRLAVSRADGSGSTRLLPDSLRGGWGSWSPDGTQIVYIGGLADYSNRGFWLVGADGTDPHPILVRNSGSDPKWSPTDDRILFVDDGDIYVMRSDGTNVTNITNTASGESNAIWSPDGARIAFSEVIDSYWEIGVINVDGSGRIAVTRGHGAGHAHLFPKWSPDGSALVSTLGFPWPYLETVTAVPNGSYVVIAPGGSQPAWR
jgi:uncharacterized protein YjdB